MSALIVGDLHLDLYLDFGSDQHGNSNRLMDMKKALKGYLKICKDMLLEYILFEGDIFDNRAAIPSPCLKVWGDFLKDAEAQGIKIIVCKGNHDEYSENISALEGFPLMTLIKEPKAAKIGDLKVFFIPYDKSTPNIRAAIKEAHRLHADLIVGHFGLGDVELQRGFCEKDKAFSIEFMPDGPLTVLGHYHSHKKVSDNVYYIGAPVGQTFAEANQKKYVMAVYSKHNFELVPVDWVKQLKQIKVKDEISAKDLDTKNFYYKIQTEGDVVLPKTSAIVRVDKKTVHDISPEIKKIASLTTDQILLDYMVKNPPEDYPDRVKSRAEEIVKEAQ